MARLSKASLLERILNALEDSGWRFILGSASHPFELLLSREESTVRLRTYVWNITPVPGQIGRKSSASGSENGSAASGGCHTSRSRSKRGKVSVGAHTSTRRSSPSTIQ